MASSAHRVTQDPEVPTGLRAEEVYARLLQYGYNELQSGKAKNIWQITVEVMQEPMFLLLLSCAVLYMILGDYREGSVILGSTLIIIVITFYQYRKTEKALEALRNLSSPRALVIRDGIEVRIPGREVVPGDILWLHEGDRIPADVHILQSWHLIVDESLLTGESVPVHKNHPAGTSDESVEAFSGTLVVQGRALAVVRTTGMNTRFGKIGASLNIIQQSATRLQTEMKGLIRNLFLIGILLCLAVIMSFYVTRGNLIQSILSGLASAMAILPEEFPVVLTVFLALGAWRLSSRNVLTRQPSAIETLGSITVLCTDKTGTITQNKMEVALYHNGNTEVVKHEFATRKDEILKLAETAHYASQPDSRDPMEKAITSSFEFLRDQPEAVPELVREYPFTRELMAMTRVLSMGSGLPYEACCKGAPEAVLPLCGLSPEEINAQTATIRTLAGKGYRILATARCTISAHELPDSQENFSFHFLGFIGLEDPIRFEVPQAISDCHDAGIRVIMITGDYPVTARSIATQAGLDANAGILTGEELMELDDLTLQHRIRNTNIFARVIPEQKLRIVEALKANGEIVAMTGDGVNDAPALKAAHIGISMGEKGTDVAREASSLVLLDDNFASIVAAIRTGRKIFDNLQKAMAYIIAVHIPIIGLSLIPALIPSLPLILLPLHIVFMELIIDPICSIAFESEQEEKGIMKRPPRKTDEPFFGFRKIIGSALRGGLLLGMVVIVYFITAGEGHTEKEIRAIVFSALIVGNVFLILTSLSSSRSFLSAVIEKNVALLTIVLIAITVLFLVLTVPSLQAIFSFEFPGFTHFIPSVAGAGLMLVILETIKFIQYGHSPRSSQNAISD